MRAAIKVLAVFAVIYAIAFALGGTRGLMLGFGTITLAGFGIAGLFIALLPLIVIGLVVGLCIRATNR